MGVLRNRVNHLCNTFLQWISQLLTSTYMLWRWTISAVGFALRKVVGYIHGYLDKEKETLFICHLKVFEEFQRRSVGRLLLDGAVKKAMKSKWKMSQIALNVIQRNYPARQFYEKLGFAGRNVKVQDKDYKDSVSDLYRYVRYEKSIKWKRNDAKFIMNSTTKYIQQSFKKQLDILMECPFALPAKSEFPEISSDWTNSWIDGLQKWGRLAGW